MVIERCKSNNRDDDNLYLFKYYLFTYKLKLNIMIMTKGPYTLQFNIFYELNIP